MKIILAPDSFKGSLSAVEVCHAMERGIRRVFPSVEIVQLPMADGGEGTVEALVASTQGQINKMRVTGPLGSPVEAFYGLLGVGKVAVIEMAAASGLPLVPEDRRNPMYTTSYGTGELIQQVLNEGADRIIVGIGGSATTDCGTGMAQALGVQFFDQNGLIEKPMTGQLMGTVKKIDIGRLERHIGQTHITVACDVQNPLLGPTGAVAIYASQKGARPEDLPILEANMGHMINLIEEETGRRVRDLPGAGAAGGLGAGLVAFLNADIKPGIDIILEEYRFSEHLSNGDLVITGEGCVDCQTNFGKAVAGVLGVARKQKVPGALIAGSIEIDNHQLKQMGVSFADSLCSADISLADAVLRADELIADRTETLIRNWMDS